MNKTFVLAILASILVLNVVSATIFECEGENTVVAGTVYDGDGGLGDGIAGADVTVLCYHGDGNSTAVTTTDSNGHYSVFFEEDECDYGDEVTVTAEKNDMTGENDGSVSFTLGNFCGCDVNVGIVNVPLIPEFGIMLGALTIVGALVAFMAIRRH